MRHARFVASAGAALLFAYAGAARGDDNGASTALFNAGRDLMKGGNYAAACPKLEESVRLQVTVGALAKLAECEEHEGRLASAYGRWQQALNLARSSGDTRAAQVESALDRLGRLVPKLRLMSASDLPAGAQIDVDKLTLGVASLGLDLPVDPGEHAVTVRASGSVIWSGSVHTLADGATTVVTIAPNSAPKPVVVANTQHVEHVDAPPSNTGSDASPAPAQRDARATRHTAALVTGGAGGLALGAALGLTIAAVAEHNASGCHGASCPTDAAIDKYRTAQTLATASEVGAIVGATALATATVLWLWPSGRDHEGVRVLPSAGPREAGVWFGGAF